MFLPFCFLTFTLRILSIIAQHSWLWKILGKSKILDTAQTWSGIYTDLLTQTYEQHMQKGRVF